MGNYMNSKNWILKGAALGLIALGLWGGYQAYRVSSSNGDRPNLKDYQLLVNQPGAQLYLKSLNSTLPWQSSGNKVYVQIVDLRTMTLDQVIGREQKPGKNQGIYYQGETQFSSPFFQNMLFSDVQKTVVDASGENRLFSIFNGAFFEQHEAETQFAFPLKHRGKVLTGGNSPYGPRKIPADPQFKDVNLLALVWNPGNVAIIPYSPASGAPLAGETIAEAVVSYDYRDHPAYRYLKDTPNRFHLLGTIDADGKPGDELLAIVTVNQATLDQTAALLRDLGVTGSIMTIDGGASTYLFTPTTGAVTIPAPTEKASRQLPHYFVIRQRTGSN
jgi:hypothetical protein